MVPPGGLHSIGRFHHFGLAVHDPDQAFLYLATLGYSAGAMVFDPLQQVYVAMRHHLAMPDVEVIWPREKPSPLDGIIKGRDSLIYHLCYTTSDAAAAIIGLQDAGLQVRQVVEPRPALLFGGVEVSFYLVGGVGLIELIHGEL